MSRVALALATALVGIAAAFSISSWSFERFLVDAFDRDIHHIERSESRLSLSFDTIEDLIIDAEDGLDNVQTNGGSVQARLTTGQANVRLNLRGRWLDARRFQQLIATIDINAPAEMVLIFDEPGRLVENKVRVALVAGRNELNLPLSQMPWLTGSDQQAQKWGGSSGRVAELRLYLRSASGAVLILDEVRFVESLPGNLLPSNPIDRVEWRSSDSQSDLHSQTASRLGVRLPVWLDTPERLLAIRDAARQADPETLFYPALRTPAADSAPRPTFAADLPMALVLCIGAMLLVVRTQQGRLPQPGRAILLLVAATAPWIWLLLSRHFDADPGANAWAVLLICLVFILSNLRLQDVHWIGDHAAWIAILKWTLPLAVLTVGAGLVFDHFEWQSRGRVLGYLPFVAVQQLVLLGFLLPHARGLSNYAVVIAAALFGLLHVPNFALTVASAFAAFLWCQHFSTHRSFAPIVFSHVVLGLAAVSFAPPFLLYSAEAGARYFLLK